MRPLCLTLVCFVGLGASQAFAGTNSGHKLTRWEPRYHYTVRQAEARGPTIVVLAGNTDQGEAGKLAAMQMRHWEPSRGTLIVVWQGGEKEPPADRFIQRTTGLPRLFEKYRPDWLLELAESYDCKSKIPASTGATLCTLRGKTSTLAGKLLRQLRAQDMHEAKLWKTISVRSWPTGSVAEITSKRWKTRTLVVTTSAKHPRSRRLWMRVRQQRMAAHAWLREIQILPKNASPDRMTGKVSTQNRKRKRQHERPLLVAIYDGPGAVSSSGHDPRWIRRSIAHLPNLEPILVGPSEIRGGVLEQFDVVIFGGGYSRTQAKGLGENGRMAVRQFVRSGGTYVGICAGAFLASSNSYALHLLNAKMSSGSGTCEVPIRFTEAGHEWLGSSGIQRAKFSGGPVNIRPAKESKLPPFKTLAIFAANAEGIRQHVAETPAIIAAKYGLGRVIAFSTHCERFPGPQDAFWKAIRQQAMAEVEKEVEGK